MIILRQKQFSFISRGVRFIKDLRTIDPLPISLEDYEKLLYGDLKYNKSNNSFSELKDDEVDVIKEKINSYYSNKESDYIISSIGRTFAEGYYSKRSDIFNELVINNKSKKYWDSIKYSYNRINELPKRYIANQIGNGSFGVVFEYPGNKIEKVSLLGFTPKEYKFYNYLKHNPNRVFPKIYDLEKDQVIMERLRIGTSRIKECQKYIYRYIIKETRTYGVIDRKPNWKLMEKELSKDNWFYVFVKEVEDGLEKIFGFKTLGDFHIDNIGERNNGDLVYFDPIGGLIAMEE